MNASICLNRTNLISNGLGLMAVLYSLAVLAGARLPLISSSRAAFYGLTAIGFTMCAVGMGKVGNGLGWTHPITLSGILLGIAALGLVAVVAFGIRVPFVTTERLAFIVLAVLIAVKWGLALVAAGMRSA